jgi:hypothetical protein
MMYVKVRKYSHIQNFTYVVIHSSFSAHKFLCEHADRILAPTTLKNEQAWFKEKLRG